MHLSTIRGSVPAKRITANALEKCKEKLTNTTSGLEAHLEKVNTRLQTLLYRELEYLAATQQSEIEFKTS